MKYDDLVAEAAAKSLSWEQAISLVDRLAAAIRDLQQHVPPEGRRVTEYKDGEGNMVMLDPENSVWEAYAFDDELGCIRPHGLMHPTAAAAMAAREGGK